MTATQVAQRALLSEGTAFASLAKLEQQGYVARVATPADAVERAFGSTTVQDLLDAGPAFRAAEAPGSPQGDLTELA